MIILLINYYQYFYHVKRYISKLNYIFMVYTSDI